MNAKRFATALCSLVFCTAAPARAISFELQGSIPGLVSPQYMEVDGADRLYVTESLSISSTDVAAFDAAHLPLGHFATAANFGINVAAAPNGHFYVLESGDIRDFDANWQSVGTFGTHGPGAAITADTASNIYISDGVANKVTKYSPAGQELLTFTPTGAQALNHPNSIAVDEFGNIIVADSFNDRVEVFHSNGDSSYSFSTVIPGFASSHARDIALFPFGFIVLDTSGLAAFSPNGALLTSLQIDNLGSIAFDGDTLYATRNFTGEVLLFAVPEPSTGLLVGLSAISLLRRRPGCKRNAAR